MDRRGRGGATEWRRSPMLGVCRIAFALAVLLSAAGCATTPSRLAVGVNLSLNAQSYQIGEPVLATVEVVNQGESLGTGTSGPPLILSALDNSTLTFYLAQKGSPVRMKRKPVLPENSPGDARTVAVRQSTSRTLLFDRLTTEAGDWAMMATLSGCRTEAGKAEVEPTYYSKMAEFHVTDKVMFKRDPYSGLIMREEAIRLARERAGTNASEGMRAVLVPLGDGSIYVWHVLIGGGEDPVHKATKLAVNPYSGAVEPLELGEPSQEGGQR